MNTVVIRFPNSTTPYYYLTRLPLKVGAKYVIETDCGDRYRETPVEVVGYSCSGGGGRTLKTIVRATEHNFRRKSAKLKKIYANKEKGAITAIWVDGVKTTLHLQKGDNWDMEKAVAMIYMKRFFDNKGYFNDIIDEEIAKTEFYVKN